MLGLVYPSRALAGALQAVEQGPKTIVLVPLHDPEAGFAAAVHVHAEANALTHRKSPHAFIARRAGRAHRPVRASVPLAGEVRAGASTPHIVRVAAAPTA
jgi:hypothetical protein